VVSNAGIVEMLAFEDITPEQFRRMVETHLFGSFHVCQPAYRIMKEQGYGRIVLIASSAGAFGMSHGTHYAAAKAGVIGLTNNIALEGEAHGILANAVLPFALTRMAAPAGEPEEGSLLAVSTTDTVSPLVVFLASRDCTVTHRNFSACAGRYARAFVGCAEGWVADGGSTATADDLLAHFDQIDATDPYIVPNSLVDEMTDVASRSGIGF
jgi:NAD(P)-dependent dehydrogenase (short-subunit alcohol dehydrogenase family)